MKGDHFIIIGAILVCWAIGGMLAAGVTGIVGGIALIFFEYWAIDADADH